MMQNYIKPLWPAPKNIHAYTTTRMGGISEKSYKSFNLADHVADNLNNVLQNRSILRNDLNLKNEPYWLKQTHSTRVICLDDLSYIAPQILDADASYTLETNIIPVVMTADCLPILLCAKDASCVAAIHAGWRGLAYGIIENTVQAILNRTSIKASDIIAWFGPAIGPNAFEIKDDVRQIFLTQNPKSKKYFSSNTNSRETWNMNIYSLAKERLASLGINDVFGGDLCTFSDDNRFFSYRRDGVFTGRIASLIWRE